MQIVKTDVVNLTDAERTIIVEMLRERAKTLYPTLAWELNDLAHRIEWGAS